MQKGAQKNEKQVRRDQTKNGSIQKEICKNAE